jgi:hypothetical protein
METPQQAAGNVSVFKYSSLNAIRRYGKMQQVGAGFPTDASVADVEIGDHQRTVDPGAKPASTASSRPSPTGC